MLGSTFRWLRENSVALASVAVAACALLFAFWQANQQQLHDRLTVRPDIQVRAQTHSSPDVPLPGIYLRNVGLGPAYVTEISALYEGQSIDTTHDLMLLVVGQWLAEHPEREDTISWTVNMLYFDTSITGWTICKGEYAPLVTFSEESPYEKAFSEFLLQELTKLAVRVQWRSVYGEDFVHTYTTRFADLQTREPIQSGQ